MTSLQDPDAPNRRVVITGVGVVCPLGRSSGELWQAIEEGRSGVGPLTRFDAQAFQTRIAAQVPDAGERDRRFDEHYWRTLDLRNRFAVSAALSAVQGAGLSFSPQNRGQVAIVIGSEGAGDGSEAEVSARVSGGDLLSAIELLAGRPRSETPAATVASMLGVSGAVLQVGNGAAGGMMAIIEAARMIRHGDALVAVAGGSEAPLTPLSLATFEASGQLAPNNGDPATVSQPLDQGRSGFVLGEGAAMITLEALEVAEARNVKILAELEGEGASFSPGQSGRPALDEQQIGHAIQLALATSGRIRAEIDVVALDASGSVEADRLEAVGVKRVFGAATRHHMYTPALKGHTGELLAASGPLSVVMLLEAMHRGRIPQTLNLLTEDPEIDLDGNPLGVRSDNALVCIANSTGVGHNASVVLAHPRVMRPFEPPADSGGPPAIPRDPI